MRRLMMTTRRWMIAIALIAFVMAAVLSIDGVSEASGRESPPTTSNRSVWTSRTTIRRTAVFRRRRWATPRCRQIAV